MTRQIPKIIHQTHYSNIFPALIADNIEKIKGINNHWEYRFYDDDDITRFISENYPPEVLKSYLRIDKMYGAARADLFRYLLMYKAGGVYLDIKSSLKIPLDDVIRFDDGYILCQWENSESDFYAGWGLHPELKHIDRGEFQQWHIITAPQHPFLAATIEKVLTNIKNYNPGLHGVGKIGVTRLTGPIAYTQAITPILNMHPHRLIANHTEIGLEYSIFGAHNKSHKKIFKQHYSELTHSIVHVSTLKKLLAPFFRLFTRLTKHTWPHI